jgi:hypothetical protein
LAKPRSDNNNDNYDDNDNNKDVMIASVRKNNDDHDVVYFAPVAVAITAADEGAIRLRRCSLTLTLSRRRKGGDPLLSKLWSANDNKDNDALIARESKNNKDRVQSSLGLQTTVELPAQPEGVVCQEAVP